ncbi:MAG: hypothetical protein CMH54_08365 [Myxococcales bacterium]|nr:hypothetical protein [Myxococcales bacterium]
MSLLLALCVVFAPIGCGERVDPDLALQAFLDDKSGPPEPRPSDEVLKGKADAIVLPAISVVVADKVIWAIGALIIYIGAQEVFNNTIEDFETVLEMTFGQSADWSWAEQVDEPLNQAEHLTESLNRIAYRSETSDFYSVNGNDYLRFLNMASPINVIDPQKLKDLMDGKVRPWGKYAKDFFAAIQMASMQARHLAGQDGAGLCARATVRSLSEPFEDYIGLARAKGPVDVVPAVIYASLRATIRCGMYDSGIREYIYSYYKVGGPMDAIPDIFISHMLKSAKLLYMVVDSCQLPPTIVVDMDGGDCFDVTIN